jgi:hypothetical protein
MAGQLSWYDIFDIAPDSSADEVQRAFDEKTGVLRPELISGASSKVVTAAERARAALEAGRHILTDPASRRRYDEEIGIRTTGGGLCSPEVVSAAPEWTQSSCWTRSPRWWPTGWRRILLPRGASRSLMSAGYSPAPAVVSSATGACMSRWSGLSRIRCRSRDWWWISLRSPAARFAAMAR